MDKHEGSIYADTSSRCQPSKINQPNNSKSTMDIATQRKIDRFFGFFLCCVFLLSRINRTGSSKITRVEKIRVVLLSEMGSWVHAHAMFERIESKYPQASVSVLLFKQNRAIVDILNYVPAANILTIDPSSFRTLLADIIRVWLDMRRIRSGGSYYRIVSIPVSPGFFPPKQNGYNLFTLLDLRGLPCHLTP